MKPLFSCLFVLIISPLGANSSLIDSTQLLKRMTEEMGCVSVKNRIYSDHQELSLIRPLEVIILNEYGFQYLHELSLHCQQQKIKVKIYRMIDSVATYGIFTFYRTPRSSPLKSFPIMAQEGSNWIAFAQSNFYVQVYRKETSNSSRTLTLKIASYLSKALPRDWELPSIVHHLPKNNKLSNSEVFVMGHHALNQRFNLYTDDLFGLKHGAEAVLANYKSTNDLAKLLLIIYPNQHLAKKYLKLGYQKYRNQNPNKQIFYKREGPLAIIVLDSNNPEFATSFLEQVSYVSSVTWDPKLQPILVGQMMLDVFRYVGVVVGGAILTGLFFGGLRVFLTRFLPEKYLYWSSNWSSSEIIQLNINRPRKKS